jgi:hypothetical protein
LPVSVGRLISNRRRDTIATQETSMRMMWAALCLLLATAGCLREEPISLGRGGVQNELPRTNMQLGGGLPLFAAPIWSDTRNVDPYVPANGVINDEDIFTDNVGLPDGRARASTGTIGRR